MGKNITINNKEMLIALGLAISSIRQMRGLSQEDLSEKAEISRSLLSYIESPGKVYNFSMDAFLNIASALEVKPDELMKSAMASVDLVKSSNNKTKTKK